MVLNIIVCPLNSLLVEFRDTIHQALLLVKSAQTTYYICMRGCRLCGACGIMSLRAHVSFTESRKSNLRIGSEKQMMVR